jgi:ATPase subunit of ABC transporter with duplicated ATPase domains
LSLVARLNSDPDRILSGDALSPGELRKIMLAQGVLQEPQLIIMDEPTNHLDLQSVEALEGILADCPCALVLVSHAAPFLDAVTTVRWNFSLDGTVSLL